MRILFLTPRSPFPPTSGGLVKTERMLRHLCASHKVDIALLYHGREDNPTEILREVRAAGQFEDVILGSCPGRRTIFEFVASIFSGVPFGVHRNRSGELHSRLGPALERANVIVVDHYLMYQFVPKRYQHKTVYHGHNAEYKIWHSYAKITKSLLRKFVMRLEAWRVGRYELKMISAVPSYLLAPNDFQALRETGLKAKAMWLETYHLSDDATLAEPIAPFEQRGRQMLFVGTLSWEPNADAVAWFAEQILPKVRQRYRDAEFTVVGGGASEELRRRMSVIEGVTLIGFAPELSQFFATVGVFVAPMRFGSGIKVKVIEAMYRGCPVVSTSCGVEGVGGTVEHEYLVSDHPDEFARNIIRLFEDPDLWDRLSGQSRQFSSQHLSWGSVLKNIDNALNHAARLY
jgi:glycosyltransferase involved in cell wall biosynthesis